MVKSDNPRQLHAILVGSLEILHQSPVLVGHRFGASLAKVEEFCIEEHQMHTAHIVRPEKVVDLSRPAALGVH